MGYVRSNSIDQIKVLCYHTRYFQRYSPQKISEYMTRQQIKKMIMDLLAHVDYDLAKSYDPKTAEEPEYAKEEMEKLIDIAKKHLKKK